MGEKVSTVPSRLLITPAGARAGTNKKGRLLIFSGIPGSGKTTIAHMVAERIGRAVHIQTDTVRFMIPMPDYSWGESKFVYQSAFLVGRQALKNGYDAILDGTFLREDYRDEARRKLAKYYSSAFIVCILCEPPVARVRNTQRNLSVPEASFNRLIESFERPKDAIFVRSDRRSPESSASFVLRNIGGLGPAAR
jgi:predicted kinase